MNGVGVMDEPSMATLPTVARGKLLLGGLGFLGFTGAIFWWLFTQGGDGHAGLGVGDLRWRYLLPLLLVLPVESLASATRIWLICRVLHPGVSFWVCLQSEFANVAVALLTPSQSGGGPGQIYLLRRSGVSVGTGLTATLLSFMGTLVGLLLLGCYSLAASGTAANGLLFRAPVWALTLIASVLLLGAASPDVCRAGLAAASRTVCRALGRRELIRDWRPPGTAPATPAVDRMDVRTARLVDLLYTYRDDVRRFLRHGTASVVAVGLLSVVFLLARAVTPYFCARFLGVEGGSFRQIVEAQMALIFLVFFAPTPGGAGIAEGASLTIMADIVPAALAPYYNLLWRFSTAYLAALAGFVCLGRALVQDASRITHAQPQPR